jgi:sensor histidine kinase YesM
MRLILENSEWTEITLAEDLHALEIYMQLENLRLDQRFTYDIRIAPGIDKENLLVPPLILQPFVENAIWHGVSAKPGGQGHILVDIQTRSGSLQCIVEDNGPGIKGAGIDISGINGPGTGSSIRIDGIDGDSKDHRSLGQKITSSRIDILNQIKNTNASINITSPPQGGTRVELLLPITPRF